MEKKNYLSPSTSKSVVQTCGVNFGKIKIFVFMVIKTQEWTCELRGHGKKKIKFPPIPSTSKLQVQTCAVNFRKIKRFVFIVLKRKVWTC